MTSKGSTDYSDLLQAAELAKKVQTLIEGLAAYVDVASIPAKDGYLTV